MEDARKLSVKRTQSMLLRKSSTVDKVRQHFSHLRSEGYIPRYVSQGGSRGLPGAVAWHHDDHSKQKRKLLRANTTTSIANAVLCQRPATCPAPKESQTSTHAHTQASTHERIQTTNMNACITACRNPRKHDRMHAGKHEHMHPCEHPHMHSQIPSLSLSP